jgi:hypothetical protein
MNKNLRNILIVLVLAALVVLIPGGGKGANTAIQAVYLAFLASFVGLASVQYRQHRMELYSLGDSRRALLYVSLGVIAVTFTATSRLWHTATGEIVWIALIAGAVYAVFTVWWAVRRY